MVRRKGRAAAEDLLLPGYSDLHEIGGGAFATVFRAVEVETGRPVALKILKIDTIHAHLIETFHHEIQALAAVSDHPNIVTLYRPSTTTDGRPVLVLELCRESLAHQLRLSGPLAASDVTRIGIKIAGALETAHRNGFLHRDMKPQNILITQFGEPALADFGVAALQASAQMTAGVFGFTTLHAAPEVLEGHHLSPATDVYGLASTMYQLLTGRAPFATFENEAPASVILRILRDPVSPLRGDHIPLDLADLLEAALSKQPEGRPRTAAEFAQALQTVEAANAWPDTSFVAWGEEGVAPTAPPPAETGRGPMGVATGPDAPGRAGAERERGSEIGPPRPEGRPSAEGGGGAGRSGAGGVAGVAGVGAGGPGEAGAGMAPARTAGTDTEAPPSRSSLPPLLPPSTPPAAPAAPVRPSLVTPEPARRNVVQPVDAVRGRFGAEGEGRGPAENRASRGASAPTEGRPDTPAGHRTASPVPPAAPPSPPSAPSALSALSASSAPQGLGLEPSAGAPPAPSAGRPTFIDPDPSDVRHTTSVYEETMGVQQILDRPAGRRPEATAATAATAGEQPSRSYPPMWAVAALVVAVLVIVAAVLVLAGVI